MLKTIIKLSKKTPELPVGPIILQNDFHIELRTKLGNIGKELGVVNAEDWYHVRFVFQLKSQKRHADIREIENGKEILNLFSKSHIKALQCVFPEYNFKIWRFSHVPNSFWDDGNAITGCILLI